MADISPLDLIGNTPLLRLFAEELPPQVRLYAKAEWFNLGGSVKDRPALWMIRDGERRGLLRPGMRIADATSGNTGIAYATIGAALGYGVTLALPANASIERRRTLRALGAALILTDPAEGMDVAIDTIRALVAQEPERYFYPDQYSNPANPQAHYETTAPEIWQQTSGAVTHFVAALGTSGTFMGTSRRLREYKAGVRCIAVQPDGPYHALEGVKHMASTRLVPRS
jgi:cysteine synthase B